MYTTKAEIERNAMCMQDSVKEEVDYEHDCAKIEIVEEELIKTENHIFASEGEESALANETKCGSTSRSVQDFKQRYLAGNDIPKCRSQGISDTDYLFCSHCKGLFLKKYLALHCRNCVKLTDDVSKKRNHLSASQALSSLEPTRTFQKSRVREEVFDTMKADDISLVAQTDPLICQIGEHFLKVRNTKRLVSACSFRMRALAKLLKELRLYMNNDKYELQDALHPAMFNLVIKCIKKISGYDPVSNTYRTSSITARMSSTLKQASELLVSLILKPNSTMNFDNPKKKLKYIRQFRNLIVNRWNSEIGCIAFNVLKESKPPILPLTKDIVKFKEFVIHTANQAVAALREDAHDKKEFKRLVDATLALTILYNRIQIEDVQCIRIQTYLQTCASGKQEEYMNMLSISEKFLTKHCKGIVTEAEHRRAAVIFFPQNIEEYVDVIIELRSSTNVVPDNNPYLFTYPDSNTWARGDVAICTFAQMADLEYPKEIASNKLLKQIATVMHILNLTEEESQQFSQFMGCTEKGFCKLPPNAYQVAKISKLLILMDKGLGDKYKGKSLQEIDINPLVECIEYDEELDVENTQSSPKQLSSACSSKKARNRRKIADRSLLTRDQKKVAPY